MADTDTDVQREAVQGLYRQLTACRMCESSRLTEYLNLGNHPPSDQFRTKEELALPEVHYPLRVLLCEECGLSQLSHVVNPRVLYQHDYPYESSTTKTGKAHWDAFAKSVQARLALAPESLVVDVGSNVGTLLDSFKSLGMNVAGIDPAPNIVAIANENGIPTLCDFYGKAPAAATREVHGRAAVIVGTNVFAHIDDLSAVMNAHEELLEEDGVFIFESPHMGHLVEHLEYDTIYHEHLSYLSLRPVVSFVARFGREVFAVERTAIHGGSFRVYIGKKGQRPIDASVEELLAEEKMQGLHSRSVLEEFANRVAQNREELIRLVEKLLQEGKKIAGLSAPAKGMTLLNYCGFGTRELAFITEKSKLKIGRHSPGGYIPIREDAALLDEKVDYALLLAWNFAPEIIKNTAAFKEKGGKYIIPIPSPKIV
jgi:SAM-dependent methyltransferase